MYECVIYGLVMITRARRSAESVNTYTYIFMCVHAHTSVRVLSIIVSCPCIYYCYYICMVAEASAVYI